MTAGDCDPERTDVTAGDCDPERTDVTAGDCDPEPGVSLWKRLKPLLSIADGLATVLTRLAMASAIGAVLGFLGLVLLGFRGGWILVAFVLAAVALVPAFLTWQGAQAFGELRGLPRKLRDLGQLPERAVVEAKAMLGTRGAPRPKGLLSQARPVVKELVSLVPVVATVRSFNPALLMGIAGAAAAAAFVTAIGSLIFLLALFL